MMTMMMMMICVAAAGLWFHARRVRKKIRWTRQGKAAL